LGIEDALAELKVHNEANDIRSTLMFFVEKITLLEKKAGVILRNTVEINQTTKENGRQSKQTPNNSVESLRLEYQILDTTLKIQTKVELIKGT
jgi:hypothetical protein